MDNTIGKRISAHRKRWGMTQEQLAEQLGITAQAVSKWENNQSCPDITTLPLLADIFGISTDELLGREVKSTENSVSVIDNTEKPHEESSGPKCHAKAELSFRITSLPLLSSAALLIIVGVLYLLSRIYSWDCNFWDILWPTTLFVFGIAGMFANFSVVALITACFGAFFLVYNIVPLPFSLGTNIPWFAVCCIICGLILLFTVFDTRKKKSQTAQSKDHTCTYEVNDTQLNCSNSFGEQYQVVTANLLSGGTISNSFGEYIVDLSGVDAITDNCQLNVSCSFGELKILVPKQYAVTHKTTKAFADLNIKGKHNDIPVGYIHIKASVNFGEVQIEYI